MSGTFTRLCRRQEYIVHADKALAGQMKALYLYVHATDPPPFLRHIVSLNKREAGSRAEAAGDVCRSDPRLISLEGVRLKYSRHQTDVLRYRSSENVLKNV